MEQAPSLNRDKFSNLSLFEETHGIKLTWNFFATSHGKGVVDGMGGTVKRTAWHYAKAGKKLISTPQQFAMVTASLSQKVHVHYMPSADVQENSEV